MTQKELVIKYIKDFGSITPMDAFADLGITKLATVVSNLIRHDGWEIQKTWEISKNRYGKAVMYKRYSFPEVETDGRS